MLWTNLFWKNWVAVGLPLWSDLILLNFVFFVLRVMLFTASVSGVVAGRGLCLRVLSMASPSTRVSPSSSSRGTRGLLLRRELDVSLVDSGFSIPTGSMRYTCLQEPITRYHVNIVLPSPALMPWLLFLLLNNRIVHTSTLRSSWLMSPTPPFAMTQGSTGYARMCTSTASSVVSPLQARSTVVCEARATHTTRTGPRGGPPGSATRPSPSAATAELICLDALMLWSLSHPDFDSIWYLHCIVKFCYLCSEPDELC